MAKRTSGFGKHDGKDIEGIEIKFSGGTRFDEVLHEGETLHLVVAIKVGASKYATTEKKGQVREIFVNTTGAMRLPDEMVGTIEEQLRLAAGEPNLDDALNEAG